MKAHKACPAGVKQQETTFTATDGATLRAVIYRPSSASSQAKPLVVLYHGGGFCTGIPEIEQLTARNLVRAHGVVVISLDYRHAPEYRFPFAINDAWDGLQWAARNARSYDANPSLGFIVGGVSAGANLAACVAHMARDEDLSPPLTGQYLAIPVVATEEEIPTHYRGRLGSYAKFRDAPALPVAAINASLEMYRPDVKDGVHFSIINHPRGHTNLPPAYLQIAGGDPLRDQGLIYEAILREEAKIPTRLTVYPGLPHGWWGVFPSLSSSRTFRLDQIKGFGWLLGVPKAHAEADQDFEVDREVAVSWVTKIRLMGLLAYAKLAKIWT